MDEETEYTQELYEALVENQRLTKDLKQNMIQIEFIKFLTVFIAIMTAVILIKVIWW